MTMTLEAYRSKINQEIESIERETQLAHRRHLADLRDARGKGKKLKFTAEQSGKQIVRKRQWNGSEQYLSAQDATMPTAEDEGAIRKVFQEMFTGQSCTLEDGREIGLGDLLMDSLLEMRSTTGRNGQCHWSEVVGIAWLYVEEKKRLPKPSMLTSRAYRERAATDKTIVSLSTISATDQELISSVGKRDSELSDELGEVGLLIASMLGATLTEAILRTQTFNGAIKASGLKRQTCYDARKRAQVTVALSSAVSIGRRMAGRLETQRTTQRAALVAQGKLLPRHRKVVTR
ncbi:MAG: hypothetical protein KGI50_06975 [Patescibacteria group bacterium]|nr:hypothetical protein [Patescibacteria group bacterium]